ncbi:hypothetical protein WKW77_24870 [Variovorax ureilyticus]|uniref:Uncharacterized protein n=1 Tax=Variovorax ureilyticus TaxID=1836198 RepID=A0ABU8VN76_9BURK
MPDKSAMDWLTFISTMTAALAWPLVIGVIAVAFRAEIRNLVSGMKKLKLGPVEAEMFEREAREVRKLAQALPPREQVREAQPATSVQRTPDGRHELPNIGRVPPRVTKREFDIDEFLLGFLNNSGHPGSPRSAIVNVWSALEDAIRSLAEQVGSPPEASVGVMLLDLERRRALSGEEIALVRKLYDLRDEALQTAAKVITDDAALDYVVAASTILRRTGLSDKPGRSENIRSVPLGVNVR